MFKRSPRGSADLLRRERILWFRPRLPAICKIADLFIPGSPPIKKPNCLPDDAAAG